MADASELNRLLVDRLQDVCTHLFPNGKVKGNHFLVGGLSGEDGESLQITLSGAAAGRFIDFAKKEDKGATPLWLWSRRKGIPFAKAIEEAKEFLGVRDDNFGIKRAKPKEWLPPAPADRNGVQLAEPNSEAMDYLTGERRICPLVIAKAKIGESKDGKWIVFPYFEKGENEAFHIKKLKVERVNGKKEMFASKGTRRSLYGKHMIDDNVSEITITEGECYSGDTEVLTATGWKRFDLLDGSEVVLQAHDDGSGSFVKPLAFLKKPFSGEMVHFTTTQVDLLVTPGHKMACFSEKGVPCYKQADSIRYQVPIPKTTDVNGTGGLTLSNTQLKFCLAISADAKIDTRKHSCLTDPTCSRYAHLAFKKQRKKDRFEAILKELGLVCRITHNVGNGGSYTYYSMPIPDWCPGRILPWDWIYRATNEQRHLLINEIALWDGNFVKGRNQTEYSSIYEENASWVQALASTCGFSSTIMDRSNQFGEWKKVSILMGKKTASISPKHTKRVPFDGIVYCVTVPSGKILVRRNRKIAVCGNCDTLSMHSLGIPAVSMPNGVSDLEWINSDWEWLERFERINICTDMDEPGRAAAPELCKRLGLHRCFIVSLPKKDVNDCLVEGTTRDEMLACLSSAKAIELDEIKRITEYTEEVWDYYNTDWSQQGWSTPWYPTIPWRVRRSEFTILSGFSGHGKTAALNQLMVHLAQQGCKIMDSSLEIKPGMTIYNMTRCALGKQKASKEEVVACHEWLNDSMFFHDCIGMVNVDRLIHAMEYARKRHGIDVFVIDSLFKCGLSSEDYGGQRVFADKLTTFCNNTGAHVILVAHSRKVSSGHEYKCPTKSDISGSSDLANAAFNVIIWFRNKIKKEKLDQARNAIPPNNEQISEWIDQPDGEAFLDKQRFGEGEEAKVPVWFERDSLQFHTRRNMRIPYFAMKSA